MSAPAALAVLAVGAAAIVAACYHLATLHDDERAARKRLARSAMREGLRQEQDLHPTERSGWATYHRSTPATRHTLWREAGIQ